MLNRIIFLLAFLVIQPSNLMAGSQDMTQDIVGECTKRIVESTRFRQESCIPVNARAAGPGISPGVNRAQNTGCIVAAPGYAIIGAAEITELICHGGRCRHDPVSMETGQDNKNVERSCLTVHAWSEGHLWGGGGHASYKFCAMVERPYTADKIIEIIDECQEKAKAN